ncbi:hypothetical protein F4781DRAFT_410682 [Annulohypoxylon bovei var. microspora]|nr:hypothetical protein F4781DRAFT_410682 [Annulohypoxylon bovei var. microspora]
MGRRPNPIIVAYFERGPKLDDNSNRYHHRCKACGEDFPKGRSDSLTAHLTKRCPAISQADRVNVCLTLHGLSSTPNHGQFDGLLHNDLNQSPTSPTGPTVPAPLSLEQSQNQIWTPLETLAEVSRQIEANEKHDDHTDITRNAANVTGTIPTTLPTSVPGPLPPTTIDTNPFELHEQYTLDNPPTNLDNHSQHNNRSMLRNQT